MRSPLEIARWSFLDKRAPSGLLLLALGLLCPGSADLRGQTAQVERQESFRAAPGGTVLGELMPGAGVMVESRDGDWAEVTVEGFVWLQSMQVYGPGELDLIVSEPGGENLRAEPQGALVGRFSQGTRLAELGRIPGWGRVSRTGWILSTALGEAPGSQSDVGAAGAQEADPVGEPGVEQGTGVGSSPLPDRITIGRGGLPVLAAPGGRNLGRVEGGTQVEVVEREGDWLRVRAEGWVRVPEPMGAAEGDGADEAAIAEGVTVEAVQRDPEAFLGRLVELELEFISVERAEALRTDFYEGEPFLLSRTDGEGGRHFVYVALAQERLAEFTGLQPLQRMRVRGRVRTPAAAITRNLLIDLVDAEILR